ncbi:MAG: Hint domain-containing protein [Candidatus Promineifilaceae bacterium]
MSKVFYLLLTIGLVVMFVACSPGGSETVEPTLTLMPTSTAEPATATPAVTPTQLPTATAPSSLGVIELKYRLLEQYPDFFFCDPDLYPVATADELALAREALPELEANDEEFEAILAHNGLSGLTTFTDEQILLIYREHKKLMALELEAATAGYQFVIQVAQSPGDGEVVSGVIDDQGTITVTDKQSAIVTCPICLAADTLISTPSGPVPVQSLRVGMVVWTVNKAGQRVAQPLIGVGQTATPAGHQVVHLRLDDGRELWVSAGHPLVDGRIVGQLQPGDLLDGAVVLSAERVAYRGAATYDLLPDGETGFYWANGILMGSTMEKGQ